MVRDPLQHQALYHPRVCAPAVPLQTAGDVPGLGQRRRPAARLQHLRRDEESGVKGRNWSPLTWSATTRFHQSEPACQSRSEKVHAPCQFARCAKNAQCFMPAAEGARETERGKNAGESGSSVITEIVVH
ncbi:hypothetical protein SRHO_G00154410 [Serrasalmus rhombeus]